MALTENWTGGNSGHGHVYKRPDGNCARCGGPEMCKVCAVDLARQNQRIKKVMTCSDCGSPAFPCACPSRRATELAYLDSEIWDGIKRALKIGRVLSADEQTILDNFIAPYLARRDADLDRLELFKIAVVVSGDQPTADEISTRAIAAGFRKVDHGRG